MANENEMSTDIFFVLSILYFKLSQRTWIKKKNIRKVCW